MKKIKDLEAKDFPGVNTEKFQEWKNAQSAFKKQSDIAGYIGNYTHCGEHNRYTPI